MITHQIFPPRARVVLSTVDLKFHLFEFIKQIYPEKSLDDREIGEIMHSVIGATVIPTIDDTQSQTAYEQTSCDLIEFYLPPGRHDTDRPYDVYTFLEGLIVRMILTTLPQLLEDGKFKVIGFSLSKEDTLILDVSFDEANNSRYKTDPPSDMEPPEWDVLESGKF